MLDAPAFWKRMNAARQLIAWTIILCSGDWGSIPEKEENNVKKQQIWHRNCGIKYETKCVNLNNISMKKRKEKKGNDRGKKDIHEDTHNNEIGGK
jgi:hypothetical protein